MLLCAGRMKYFFGKMTIYPDYPKEGLDMIMYFLKKYFGNSDKIAKVRLPVNIENPKKWKKLFSGRDFKENYKILNTEIRRLGVNIPPLVNSYMNLSSEMIYFGTGINDEFADVLDSGILISFESLYPEKKRRHVESLDQDAARDRFEAMKEQFKNFAQLFLPKNFPVDKSDDVPPEQKS